MNCQKKDNLENKQEKNSPKYPETENCSCTEKAKKDSVVLAYNMKVILKSDGRYVQFQCVDMDVMILSMNDSDGEYCETSQKLNCISTKIMEIKLPDDAIFFNATSCEEKWTPQSTQNELIKTLKNKEFEFFELYLNKNREIDEISLFVYQPEEDKVTKIEYSIYGGEPYLHESVMVTKDSIRYFYNKNFNNIKKDMAIANKGSRWSEIIHSFMLKDFKKLKNGESNQIVDGTDEKFIITTKGKTYSVMNPKQDSLNSQISGLRQLLQRYLFDFQSQSQ